MEKRILGRTGFEVSVLGLGAITIDSTEQKHASDIISKAVDIGVNYFDSAPAYGNSQYILGPALEPYRKNIYLACKTGKRTAKESEAQLYESLKALKTDYFDIYQFHAIDSLEEIETIFASGGAMETMVKAKEKGLIRNIGFTCHTEIAASALMKNFDFDTVLFPINWAYWLEKNIGKQLADQANAKNMGIIAIKALAHRKWLETEEKPYPKCWYKPIFDDVELAKLALRFTISQDIDVTLPPGDERMFNLAYDILKDCNSFKLNECELNELKSRAKEIGNIIF